MPMDLVKSYAYTFEYVYRTPPGANYNKSLTGLIALRHVSTFGAVAHQGWVARCFPCVPDYSLQSWTKYLTTVEKSIKIGQEKKSLRVF